MVLYTDFFTLDLKRILKNKIRQFVTILSINKTRE